MVESKQETGATDASMSAVHRLLAAAGLFAVMLLVFIYHTPLFSPSDLPSRLLAEADAKFVEADFDLTPEIRALSQRASRHAPLEAVPFYYAAMELDEERDATPLLALLDETLRRDPRQYFARLWRARIYYQLNLPEAAAREVIRVTSLDPGARAFHVDALVDLAQDPNSHALLLSLVRDKPAWADAFVRRANQVLADEDFLVALTSRSRTAFESYVASLAGEGEFERAFLIWQSSLSDEELLAFRWPTDPTFDPGAASDVFGWKLDEAITEREQDGLYIYFDGMGRETAASQTMLLGAGYDYTLVVNMSGQMRVGGGWFEWRVDCIGGSAPLALQKIDTLLATPEDFPVDFHVPENGCDVQSVSLRTRPGDFVYPIRARAHRIRILERGSDAASPFQTVGPGQ